MNGLEQRQRHTAIATAEVRLADLSTVVQELDGRILELARIVQRVEGRTVALGQATSDAFALVDRSVGQLQAAIGDQQAETRAIRRTLWTRLRWIAVGR